MKKLYYDFGDYELDDSDLKRYYKQCFRKIETCEDFDEEIENYIYYNEASDEYIDKFKEFDDDELMKEFFEEEAFDDYKDSQMTVEDRYGVSPKMFI